MQTNTPLPGQFSYQQNPFLSRSFMIMRKDARGEMVPVGDYTVLDWDEDLALSERKVMNLVSLLNGKHDLIDLQNQTDGRLLFHKKDLGAESAAQEIVFFKYKGSGVSRENALLTFKEKVLA